MASTERQVAELVTRIDERTRSGEMRWQRSPDPNKYQSRIGDFVVTIGPATAGALLLGNNIILGVTRLDGMPVETIGESIGSLSGGATARVPATHFGKLKVLYEYINGGSEDIDELLKLLR